MKGLLRLVVAGAMCGLADAQQSYQLDPFAGATSAFAGCPAAKPPLLSEQEMRIQAHERAERGTSCCLAGTCECGGAYKHDSEINQRVVAAIQSDKRFADTSVWVTTMRKFVTLQGCVRSRGQGRALERMVKQQQDVALVWNETVVPVSSVIRARH
jgi:BON domain-containing protein